MSAVQRRQLMMTPFENLQELIRLREEYVAEDGSSLGYSTEALRRARTLFHYDFPPELVLKFVEALRAFEHRSADLRPLLRHEMSQAVRLLDEIDTRRPS